MKKSFIKLIVSLALVTPFLSGCNLFPVDNGGGNNGNHTHTFSSEWTYDDNFHWHAATCEHKSEISDKGNHIWDNGVVTKEATTEQEGEKVYTCSVCNKTKIEIIDKIHVHSFSNEWTSDKTYHWHKCTGCNEITDKETHTLNAGVVHEPTYESRGYTEFTCSVCNHTFQDNYVNQLQHTFSDEWMYDNSGHWHPCLDSGYESAVLNKNNHSLIQTGIDYSADGTAFATYQCVCGFSKQTELTNLFLYDLLDDGTISLYAADGAKTMENLIIPAVYQGKTVSSIKANGFEKLTSLKTVKITKNNSLTTIGTHAFDGCSNLIYAVIPETITSVKSYAFYRCSNSLTIYCESESQPDGYYHAYSAASNGYWAGSADQIRWGIKDYYETDDYVFGITIHDELSISKYKGSQPNVVIPEKDKDLYVTQLGKYSFTNNTKLVSIKLHSKMKSIGTHAFDGCSNLAYAVIPESVTSIGSYAFYRCSNSLMIYCEAQSEMDNYYHAYSAASNGHWAGSAEQIWWNMVDYYETDDYLFGVTIYNELSISRYKGSQTNLVLPEKDNDRDIVQIGKYSFANNRKLVSIKLHSKMKSIGTHAFDGCSNLAYAVIPESVTSIGSYAFYRCSNSLMIYCEAQSEMDNYYHAYSAASNGHWAGSADQVWWNTTDYIVSDDYLFAVQYDGTLKITKYLGSGNEIMVPSEYDGRTVASIGKYSFTGANRRFTKVIIPNTIKSIETHAFDGCSTLQYVSIPDSVTTIGSYAFYNCNSSLMIYCEAQSEMDNYYHSSSLASNGHWAGSAKYIYYSISRFEMTNDFIFGYKLDGNITVLQYIGSETSVTIPETYDNRNVTSIAHHAFEKKNRITFIECPQYISKFEDYAFSECSMLQNIFIGSTVDYTIGAYVFNKTNLGGSEGPIGITLDPHCTYIGGYAFSGTTFTTIKYLGSADQFNNISKNSNWKKGSNISKLRIHNSDYNI